jgi:hypothetical protein
VKWVQPKLVAQVRFLTWTANGYCGKAIFDLLRHRPDEGERVN